MIYVTLFSFERFVFLPLSGYDELRHFTALLSTLDIAGGRGGRPDLVAQLKPWCRSGDGGKLMGETAWDGGGRGGDSEVGERKREVIKKKCWRISGVRVEKGRDHDDYGKR